MLWVKVLRLKIGAEFLVEKFYWRKNEKIARHIKINLTARNLEKKKTVSRRHETADQMNAGIAEYIKHKLCGNW